jgi:hypothetical protein
MNNFEKNKKENIPVAVESKYYISIAREMKKLSDEENDSLETPKGRFDKSEERFISLAREIEKAGQNNEIYSDYSENWFDRFKSSLKSYKRFGQKLARIGVLAGVLWSSMPAMPKEKTEEQPVSLPKVEEVVKMNVKKAERQESTPWYKGWRLNQVVVEKDEKGNLVFNPLKMIAPIQIEKVVDKKSENSFKFNVPYEYARLFNSAKPLSPEDHEKVQKYISKELQKKFEDKLKGLNLSIETEREIKGPQKPELTELKVSGFASPEGPQQEGPSTIESKNIDKENIELAKLRAEQALGITVENLEKLGVDKKSIDQIVSEIKAEELQFSVEEFSKLTLLSKEWKGSTPLEKVFNMIVDYNDGKIKDQQKLKELHQILASKRKVEIEVGLKGEEKKIYAVPLPLLLLAALPFIRRREKSSEQPSEQPLEQPSEQSSEQPSGGSSEKPFKQPSESIPEQNLKSTINIESSEQNLEPTIESINPLPVKPEEDSNFNEKVKIALVDDLYKFFDDQETIRRGLNYRKLCEEMLVNFNKFSSDYDREQYLARKLLQLWKEHDINARREAGWNESDIHQGLDYENQPNQMLWALAHAKVLLRLIKEKNKLQETGKKVDFLDLMSQDVENYMNEKSKDAQEEPLKKEDWLKTSIELAMEGRIAWKKD